MPIVSAASIFDLGYYLLENVALLSAYIWDMSTADLIQQFLYQFVTDELIGRPLVDAFLDILVLREPLLQYLPLGFSFLFLLIVILLGVRIIVLLKQVLPFV